MSKLFYLNASFSQTNEIQTVGDYLTVNRTFWKKEWVHGHLCRVPTQYEVSLVTRKGKFLAGWNKRIERFLTNEGHRVIFKGINNCKMVKPNLVFDNVELQSIQKELVQNALQQGRGIVLSATGTGKTIMEGAVLSNYPKMKRLVLCHSKKLLHQLADSLKKHFKLKVTKVGDGYNDTSGDVIVAIINSWASQSQSVMESIQVLIVDEAHHVNNENSLYFNVLLKHINAWNRFGFTATRPSTKEGRLICEGCFGPILGRLTIEKAIDIGLHAVVTVKLLDAPIVETESSKYKDLYKERIIYNEARNQLIVDEVKKGNAKGQSFLIYVKEIAHGKMLHKQIPNSIFIWSAISGHEQTKIANKLDKKKILNVIATTTWKEGVDIPSLDNVFNAAGGKSEIAIIQNAGRGARVTSSKDSFTLLDFVDHGRFLEGHTCDRLSIYIKNKWL